MTLSECKQSSVRKLEFERIYQVNFTSSQSPSQSVPHWFGRDIWKRYCYKKHTQRRLLCASRPRLTSPCVGKCTLSLTSWAFMVRGANTAIGYSPPCCKRPLQPHGDPESHTTSPIKGKVGVPTKFGTTQLAEPPSSSSAHQHPIPEKMGHLTTPVLDPVLLLPQ